MTDWKERQLAACRHYGVSPVAVGPEDRVGVARDLREAGTMPICGVRHLPENGTCGWYIWAGEKSEAHDFFVPLHVSHLEEWCAAALPFLLLPPGWCFVVEGSEYNAWFDPTVDLSSLPTTPRA